MRRNPELSFFIGSSTAKNDPETYMECIVNLIKYAETVISAQTIPLIINTHGWMHGMGLTLLSDLIARVRSFY